MFTQPNYAAISALPIEQQKTHLRQAIDFELKAPQMIMDLIRKGVIGQGFNHLRAANESRPSVEAIKSFIATKYASGSSNPILDDLASTFASFYHSNMPDVDMGWVALYDLVDLRTSSNDHFDIVDTNLGITFTQIKSGAQIKKRTNVTESKTTVGYLTMGAGLGIQDDWLKFQHYYKVTDAVDEFRAQHFNTMASLHYAPFTGLGSGVNIAFTTDDPSTLNIAASTLFRNLRNMGYGVGTNTGLTILCAPEKVGRITKMLTATQGSNLVAFGTAKEPIAYTINAVISSTFIPASDTGYYLILPGKKIKRGLWQDLNVEQARDAAGRAWDFYGSAQYNAAVGDVNQVCRVLYS